MCSLFRLISIRFLFTVSFAAGGCLLLYVALLTDTLSVAADRQKATENRTDLTIELRLSKDQYKSTDKVDVEVVFHNKGKTEFKVALSSEDFNSLFFDFVILGDKGTQYLTNISGNWMNPIDKPVELVRIRPGGTYRLKLKEAFDLRKFNAGVFVNESYKVLAIFRDYSHGNPADRKDPAVWRGMVLSPPATIKHITYVEEKKENRDKP